MSQITQTWQAPDETGYLAELEAAITAEQGDVTAAEAALGERGEAVEVTRGKLAAAEAKLAELHATTPSGGGAQLARQIEHWTARVQELRDRLARRETKVTTAATSLATERSEAAGAQNRLDFYQNTRVLMPWLPSDLAQLYSQTWAGNAGNAEVAWATVTADPRFEQYFPGLRRSDGSLRMTVNEYMGTIWSYQDVLLEVGVNPALFTSQLAELVRGEVSASEFRTRVAAMESRVLAQEPMLRDIYAQFWGIEPTTAALIAAALDPTVDDAIINRRIGIAEIGGEAALQGFMVSRQSAEGLYQTGIDQPGAQTLFRQAGQFLPNLTRAARRQAEGQFDLDAFLASQAYADPRQVRRLERIIAGEAAMFSSERTDVARSERGAVTGLLPR